MSNSLDLDETAHNEASLPALRCLQKPIIIACGCERVKLIRCKKKKKKKVFGFIKKKKKSCLIILQKHLLFSWQVLD